MAKDNNYNDLVSLKGPDQVRLRPAVIFGSDSVEGCRHSVFEIISNSIDEAREGYGKSITITLHADKSVTVEDHGRGIPLGYNETEQKYNCKVITFRSAPKITVTAPPDMNWTLDGEMAPGSNTIRIENLHHAIRLISRRPANDA